MNAKIKAQTSWPQGKKSILNITGLKVQKQIFAKLPDFKELAFLRQFLIAASLGGFSLPLLPTLQEEHREGLRTQNSSSSLCSCATLISAPQLPANSEKQKRKQDDRNTVPLVMVQRWIAWLSCT